MKRAKAFLLMVFFVLGAGAGVTARAAPTKQALSTMQVSVTVLPVPRCTAVVKKGSKADPMDLIDPSCTQAKVRQK